RGGIESLECVLVVRGDEDGRGHMGGADLAHHVQPAHPGHLHVQEDEVRAEGADGFYRRRTVCRGADHLDIRLLLEQVQEPAPAQRLVVDDQDAHGAVFGDRPGPQEGAYSSARRTSSRVWYGSTISASIPPPFPGSRFRRASPP